LPARIEYIGLSAEPAPALAQVQSDGTTILEWKVPDLSLGSSWNASYDIQAVHPGTQNTTVAGRAGATYLYWNGSHVTAPMPQAMLGVAGPLPPPPPPLMPPAPPAPPVPPPPPPMLPVYAPPAVMVQPQVFVQAQPAPLQMLFAPLIGIGVGKLAVTRKMKGMAVKGMGLASPRDRLNIRQKIKDRDRRMSW